MTLLLGDEFTTVLAAAQAGADWAVARLFRSLQPDLLRYLRVREPSDAEDVAAQTWLEVARALPRFEGAEDDFRAFVFTIGRRRMLNARRSRTRRRAHLVDMATLANVAPATDDPVEEVAARVDGESAVQQIRALLPPEQAEIVLLRVVAGLTVEQVAAIVGKQAGTVRVIQHRALKQLAKTFEPSVPVTPTALPGM